MKRIFLILIVLVLCLSGCTNRDLRGNIYDFIEESATTRDIIDGVPMP